MGFEDYLRRKMILKKSTFDKHTKGKYLNDFENRHRISPHIKDILRNPSEVWVSEHKIKGLQTNYIKYYGDMSVLVSTTINEQMEGLEIETWFGIHQGNDAQRRKGLLIKKAD